MHRLYLQIYVSLFAILILFALLASLTLAWRSDDDRHRAMSRDAAAVLGQLLPGPDAPPEKVRRTLEDLGARFEANLALRERDGGLIAEVGDVMPPPEVDRESGGWIRGAGRPTIAIPLEDGRWLVASHIEEQERRHRFAWLLVPVLLAGAVGVGAYPVVRRITRRLERLKEQVDELGAGDLGARVEVEGHDEVAALATSFNSAADQIEQLVDAKRSLLAAASHELRTPLARIRVGVDLLMGEDRPDLRARIAADIAELDEGIAELLLASRLDATEPALHFEKLDLLALVAEEASAADISVSGDPCELRGVRRMLQRLVRNLIENAQRYGESAVEVSVDVLADAIELRVCDRGPGVPEAERERIFEPFYRRAATEESSERGSGLGLHLVQQIARHHGGVASCEGREGGGSCFVVGFPVGHADSAC